MKMVEMNLKVKLPENYLKAAQELIDTGKWTDKDINQALNFILAYGLSLHTTSIGLENAIGAENVSAFEQKHGIGELGPEDVERILQESNAVRGEQ